MNHQRCQISGVSRWFGIAHKHTVLFVDPTPAPNQTALGSNLVFTNEVSSLQLLHVFTV